MKIEKAQRFYFVLVMIFFVLLTNHWMSWTQGAAYLSTTDAARYQAIAHAVPHWPASDESNSMFEHLAQRWFAPYIVGVLAKLSGVSVETLFSVFAFAFLALIVFLAHKILQEVLKQQKTAYVLCMALFLMNPYFLRYYLIARGMLPDLFFITGFALILLNLLRANWRGVLLGGAVAIMGRQTAVLLLPGVCAWMYFGAKWKNALKKERMQQCAAFTALLLMIYLFNIQFTKSFSSPLHLVSFLSGITDANPSEFAVHVLRLVMPHLFIWGLIVGFRSKRLPFEFWCCLGFSASILAQPFLFGPAVVHDNQNRLSALGLLGSLTALAILLAQKRNEPARQAVYAVVVLIALASLHHVYAAVGLHTSTVLVIVTLVAATMASFILRKEKR